MFGKSSVVIPDFLKNKYLLLDCSVKVYLSKQFNENGIPAFTKIKFNAGLCGYRQRTYFPI